MPAASIDRAVPSHEMPVSFLGVMPLSVKVTSFVYDAGAVYAVTDGTRYGTCEAASRTAVNAAAAAFFVFPRYMILSSGNDVNPFMTNGRMLFGNNCTLLFYLKIYILSSAFAAYLRLNPLKTRKPAAQNRLRSGRSRTISCISG